MVCVSVIKMDNLGKSIINKRKCRPQQNTNPTLTRERKISIFEKICLSAWVLYLVVMDSKEKKAWKVCNTLWSYDVMSNINSYMKNLIGDCLFYLKLQAIGSSSKQEPIYFSIQSYQFISSFSQTGTCSNIDIVLQNIWSLYSIVIHKLNEFYEYMEFIA